MSIPATVSDWAGRIRSDIEAAEWSWRNLEERDDHALHPTEVTQNRRAKEDLESEVSGLRAQLAVASFLENLRAPEERKTEISFETESDRHRVISSLAFAAIINAEADLGVPRGVETRLRSARSQGDSATGEWWVSLEASLQWRDEELSRHSYRFHVRDERVKGWSGVTEAGDTPLLREGPKKEQAPVTSPMRLITGGFERRRARTRTRS